MEKTIRLCEVSRGNPSAWMGDVHRVLADEGQCLIRGALDPEAIRRAAREAARRFDHTRDLRRSPEFAYGETPNYQRLDIGTYGGGIYQFCRTFFVFPWNPDDYGVLESFEAVVKVKNAVQGRPPEYGRRPGDPVFYGFLFHQYPRGGGFMSGHRHAIAQDNDPGMRGGGFTRHFTVGVVMSSIGVDFNSGGGWSTAGDERITWEHATQPGDLIIYDDGLLHGCHTVDLFDPLDMTSLNGRLFGLVSPFSPHTRFAGDPSSSATPARAIVQRLA